MIAADVTLESAKVYGKVEAQTLIDAVEQAGYHATLPGAQSPKTEPLTHSAPSQPEYQAAASSTIPATNDANKAEIAQAAPATESDSVQLLLSGMSCASCVSKVQHALESVDGVEVARVNLAERSALVTGNPSNDALIAAVKARRL